MCVHVTWHETCHVTCTLCACVSVLMDTPCVPVLMHTRCVPLCGHAAYTIIAINLQTGQVGPAGQGDRAGLRH